MNKHLGESDELAGARVPCARRADGRRAFPRWPQNAIQSINSSQQAGSEVVRIELSEPLAAVPAGFTVQAPPRIAIDLPGVANALGKSQRRDQPGQPALGQRRAVRASARGSS